MVIFNTNVERAYTLYLLRHCHDVASKVGKFEDLPLTLEGEAHASQIAQYLISQNITEIYSSPMKRALQTASIISQVTNIPVKESLLIKDRDVGQANGMTYHQVQTKFSHLLKGSNFGPDFRFPGGESNLEVFNRANEIVSTIFTRTFGMSSQTLVVSHSLTLNYLLYIILDMGFKETLLFQFEPGMGCIIKKGLSNSNFQMIRFDKFV